MLGSAVSSRTPTDLKPRSPCSVMKLQAEAGVHQGWPYSAVGMHSAVESSIGLPNRLTSASRMLVFVTPPDVRRSFKLPPDFVYVGENVLALTDPCGVETGRPAKTHRLRQDPASLLQGTFPNTSRKRRGSFPALFRPCAARRSSRS